MKMHLLDDYTIDARTRYENHTLYYTLEHGEPIELRGFLAAALFGALIVDTPEGNARGIALDTPAEREEFYRRYDREVRRDDWGYLSAEVEQLWDNYVQFSTDETSLNDLCPNIRLLDLAMDLTVAYMRQLVLVVFREHIWEAVPWKMTFPRWLMDAARVETRRQRFLQIDWTDMPIVSQLAEMDDEPEAPTFYFEGEKAADIMERYLEWACEEYVAMKQGIPGAKITSADRKIIFTKETDWSFMSEEVDLLDESEQKEWNRWKREWTKFLADRLQPEKEIRFWVDKVPEELQEHLLYHLQLAEQHPDHFHDLTTAVYAMRQLGYIRRKCSDKAMRQWLSEHLKLDYTEHSNASQFQRAMKEHGRYTREVQDEVMALEAMGCFRFQDPET